MADGPAGFTPDFSCPALLRVPASCMPSARTGLSPSSAGRSKPFRYWHARSCGPYNPAGALTPAVWAPPRSLATTWGITIVFSSYGYLDVSVPHVRPLPGKVAGLQPAGLPHSEIRGSMAICAYPRLIAAYHVLLRLLEPRYPPSALIFFSYVRTCPKASAALVLFSSSFHHVKDLVRHRWRLWRIRGSNP